MIISQVVVTKSHSNAVSIFMALFSRREGTGNIHSQYLGKYSTNFSGDEQQP